ncbi:MAG: ATP-dependent RecD-like DNA helicase [Bacilli bacterium]|nr:ATP-dependent RecD-like DNA helicase [Bacilli bacterium]
MASYIQGKYTKCIFKNNTGYNIGVFRVSDSNDPSLADYIGRSITFTGYFHDLNEIDTYLFYGKLVTHEKYGEQFQVESYERCMPEEKDSIVEFLTSGLFKGIGEAKAKKIVDVLGKDTLKIILETPDNLLLIPSISKKNVDTLHNKLKEYEASYETIMYLSDMGFSTKDSMIIYNTYKKDTKKVIEEDIYKLIEDINEIYFKKIDVIALKNGVKKDALIRVKASLLYIMDEVSNTYGHSYYFREELLNYLPRVLGVNICTELFDECINKLVDDLKIIIKEDRFYLREMYESETLIVKRFRLLNSNKEIIDKRLDSMILELEDFFDIKYNSCQLDAIKKSYMKDFLIITGGPGTGKTTIMKGIVELYRLMEKLSYEKLNDKIALLAPTGRAAKRMSEATGMPASTIHRFLKWSRDTNKFQVNEYNRSKVEFVIIDEASMIDTYLMASLLKGISSNCKVILVGDDHQLPSVGPGQVLHDLIESHALQVVELTELYRQGIDSNIISLAYDIRNQSVNKDIFNVEDDLTFIECRDNEVIPNICEICNTYKDLNYKKFQILAPMYKGLNGIDAINKNVQDIFNSKSRTKKEKVIGEFNFREDDKVIQLTNMPDDNVYNGDIGIIDRIQSSPKSEIHIDFDGNLVKYTPANFINFKSAYSISIHKAQGSEFDVVVIPIVNAYNKMLYQKLIYTGVTRAKKKLYIVGDFSALIRASHNTSDDIRRTTIKNYLINGIV